MAIGVGFTQEQQSVITHKETPLLVLAGPGSGKTLTLTQRCAWLIRQGVDPDRLFVATFTRKAAEELKSRLVDLLGPKATLIDIGTFHSLSAKWLKRYPHIIGKQEFAIFNDYESLNLMRDVVKQLRSPVDHEEAHLRISLAKAALKGPKDVDWPFDLVEVYEHYEQALAKENALDFSDLVMKFVQALTNNLAFQRKVQESYHHILVDEYQDINLAQEQLLRLLAAKHRRLTCVGDSDQAIFSFQGGDLAPLLQFEKTWTDATVIRLTENFRSTKTIVGAAGCLIKNNKTHKGVNLWTNNPTGDKIIVQPAIAERDEAVWIADRIQELLDKGENPTEIAVLFRLRWLLPPLEQELLARGIPFVIAGAQNFLDHLEVKESLAFLRLLDNPSDAAAFRQVASLRKVSHAVITRVIERSVQCDMTPFDYIEYQLPFETGYRSWEIRNLKAVRGAYNRLTRQAGSGLSAAVKFIPEISSAVAGIRHKNEEYLEATVRLRHLAALAEQVESSSNAEAGVLLRPFLEYIEKFFETKAEEHDAVQVLTIHRAKGLEFNHVFLMGATAEVMPHRASVLEQGDRGKEEERRLFYVALTRARSHVHITYPLTRQYSQGSKVDKVTNSPFIDELPSRFLHVLPTFTKSHGGALVVGNPR